MVPTYREHIVSDPTNLPLKQSPLYAEHLKLGAKMIGFGGWNMPVFYSSILDEHQAVRERVGIFDISHMGQIRVSGPSAEHWLNTLLTNNLQRLQMSDGQYTLLLNEQGGVIDDLIVYHRGSNDYFLVVNAAKIEEDFLWMQSHLSGEVALSDLSDHFAALAVQGPGSAELLGRFGALPARNHIQEFRIQGIPVLVARTGYTGEDGFELFYPEAAAAVRECAVVPSPLLTQSTRPKAAFGSTKSVKPSTYRDRDEPLLWYSRARPASGAPPPPASPNDGAPPCTRRRWSDSFCLPGYSGE